jgi:acetyl esterase/lipase
MQGNMIISRRSFFAGSVLLSASANARTQAASVDPLIMVDPELVAAARARWPRPVNSSTLARRRSIQDLPALPLPAPQPQFRFIPGPRNGHNVRVMIIDGSTTPRGKPVYLHMHGGGFVAGRLTQNPAIQQRFAMETKCMLVSVDYRLAPETRFPGALEDNYAALRWLHLNADALGIDRNRIAVGGDSAGGGHAAMLAIAARDRGEFSIAFQLLVYPMLDDRTGATVPVPNHIGKLGWNIESNRFGWASLLGQAPGLPTVPPGSVPARVSNLAGLPPTFIAVGGLDLFAAEDIAFAHRLNAAGTPVGLLVVPGAFHGFQNLAPEARVSRKFNAELVGALRRGLRIQA